MKFLFRVSLIAIAAFVSACGPKTGSPQNPIDLPASELAKIVDATGRPNKTASTPPIFTVTLNNQSDWHITALEITVTNKNSGLRRSYMGDPVAYIVEKGKYDAVSAISPKSAGYFFFQIGPMLSWKTRLKDGSKWEKEFVFQPYEWNIIRAIGYKK